MVQPLVDTGLVVNGCKHNMQPVNPQLAAMLQTAIRAPRAYIWCQVPAVDQNNNLLIAPYSVPSTPPTNYVPNPTTLTGSAWDIPSPFTLTTINGIANAQYTGTGSNIATSLYLDVTIPVVMGVTYVPSWWIDPSAIANGVVTLSLADVAASGGAFPNSSAIIGSVGVGQPGTYNLNAWICPTNLLSLTDSLGSTAWTNPSNFWTYGTAGPNGATSITFNANNSSKVFYQDAVPVKPGTWYTFSANFNTVGATSGNAHIDIRTSGTATILVSTTIPINTNGRRSVSYFVPAGVTSLRFNFGTNTLVGNITISQPMLEVGASPSGYYIGSENPRIKMFIYASSTQLGGFAVVSGKNLLISQPSLTVYVPNPPALAAGSSFLGSQLIIDQPLSINRISILQTGSDSFDFSLDNSRGEYSPLSNKAQLSRYFGSGVIDNKYQLYLGLAQNGGETIVPKGVYVSEAVQQNPTPSDNVLTVNCLDQFSEFRGNAYTSFPPRLYGNQLSSYYNPNYNLQNPSGDLTTFVCEACNWMTSQTQSVLWGSDYVDVAVYRSDVQNGNVAVDSTTYSVDYINGIILFSTAVPAGTIVSVDARPLAMKPELALKHLFVDYGGFDPDFLKFDSTGVMMPLVELARDRAILDIAGDLVAMIAPRGIQWNLYMDENGYMRLTESRPDDPVVEYLVDSRDLLSIEPEQSVRDMYNVVRATSVASTNQPLISVSYDVLSINVFGQKPTFDVPQQLTNTTIGMDPGTAISYLNGLTASVLFEYSRPAISMTAQVLPNPTRQVGDLVNVTESKTGMSFNCIINQIQDSISGPDYQQTLTLQRFYNSQDYMFGLQPNIGAPTPQNSNQIQAGTGLVNSVIFSNGNNTQAVVQEGMPVVDQSLSPVVFEWSSTQPLNISVGITPPTGSNCYIWRWIYLAADAYLGNNVITGNASYLGLTGYPTAPIAKAIADLTGALFGDLNTMTLPYDVRANQDTPISRRFWRPLLRCSDWITNDGTLAINTNTVLNSTWTGGPGLSNTTYYAFGGLRVGQNDYFGATTTGGFSGVQLYAPGTPAATTLGASSTIRYGVDFGNSYGNQIINYGIKGVRTTAYLCMLVAADTGVMQYKRIPFVLINS